MIYILVTPQRWSYFLYCCHVRDISHLFSIVIVINKRRSLTFAYRLLVHEESVLGQNFNTFNYRQFLILALMLHIH